MRKVDEVAPADGEDLDAAVFERWGGAEVFVEGLEAGGAGVDGF